MIHAVSDACSVRWAKVNRQVYKFQSLVFKDDENPEGKEEKLSPTGSSPSPLPPIPSPNVRPSGTPSESPSGTPSGAQEQNSATTCSKCSSNSTSEAPKLSILSQSTSKQTSSVGWRSVHGEYLEPISESPLEKTPPPRPGCSGSSSDEQGKQSLEEEDSFSEDNKECTKKGQRRVHFQEEFQNVISDKEGNYDDGDDDDDDDSLPTCPVCQQVIIKDSASYQLLMAKPKEELANMVMSLHLSLRQTIRNNASIQSKAEKQSQDEERSSADQHDEDGTLLRRETQSTQSKCKLKIRRKSPRKKIIISL